jgi:hypothetical protein
MTNQASLFLLILINNEFFPADTINTVLNSGELLWDVVVNVVAKVTSQ